MCECELDAAGCGICNIERIERDYPHVYGILTNKQRRRNVEVLAPEAFMRPLQQISGILKPREMCVFCVFVYSDSAYSQSALADSITSTLHNAARHSQLSA